jgi:hypothetical protein
MQIALVQRDEQVILSMMTGMVKVNCDAGDRQTLLAAKLDIALCAPGVECACEYVDIIRLQRIAGGYHHGSCPWFVFSPASIVKTFDAAEKRDPIAALTQER